MITSLISTEIFITINHQRIKTYSQNKIFLHDNTDFEIEIFNKSSRTIIPEIYINNNLIGSLIIRSGQRYFLDEFINENRKFIFSTYTVEDSEEINQIIKDNGKIKIKVYNEKTYHERDTHEDSAKFALLDTKNAGFSYGNVPLPESQFYKETGIIARGKKTTTEWTIVDIDVDYSKFELIEFQLLPFSEKPDILSLLNKSIQQYQEGQIEDVKQTLGDALNFL